jgi:hypothetical protein
MNPIKQRRKISSYINNLIYFSLSVDVIEKLINLCSQCLTLRDYMGAKAIWSSIDHPAVTRMSRTFEALSKYALFVSCYLYFIHENLLFFSYFLS